ncbi:Protein ZGRF1, partial [Trichoplax sp. H2]
VLYTHQKTKKAKTWQDGILKWKNTTNKAMLYDETASSLLDSIFIKSEKLSCNMDLETDRYLILIDEEISNKSSVQISEAPTSSISTSSPTVNYTNQSNSVCKSNVHNFPTQHIPLKPRKRKAFMTPWSSRNKMNYYNQDKNNDIVHTIQDHQNTTKSLDGSVVDNAGIQTTNSNIQQEEKVIYSCEISKISEENVVDKSSVEIRDSKQSQEAIYDQKTSQTSNKRHVNKSGAELRDCTISQIRVQEINESQKAFQFSNKKFLNNSNMEDDDEVSCNEERKVIDSQTVFKISDDSLLNSSSMDIEDPEIILGQKIFDSQEIIKVSNASLQNNFDVEMEENDIKQESEIIPSNTPSNNNHQLGINLMDESNSSTIANHASGVKSRNQLQNVIESNKRSANNIIQLLGNSSSINCKETSVISDSRTGMVKGLYEKKSTIAYRSPLTRTNLMKRDGNLDRYDIDNSEMIMNNNKMTKGNSISQPKIQERSLVNSGYTDKNSGSLKFPSNVLDNNKSLESEDKREKFLNISKKIGKGNVPHINEMCKELHFPSRDYCRKKRIIRREVRISSSFDNILSYKSVLTSAIREHLNIILYELACKFHTETENCSSKSMMSTSNDHSANSLSLQNQMVDKKLVVSSRSEYKGDNLEKALRRKKVFLCRDCTLLRKQKQFSKWSKTRRKSSNCDEDEGSSRTKNLLLVLNRRDKSCIFSKDDIWVISQQLSFEPSLTFIAKSTFYGPSSSSEIEIVPISGFQPSKWISGTTVNAILACNGSSEFACLDNLATKITVESMPILPHLLQSPHALNVSQQRISASNRFRFRIPSNHTIDVPETDVGSLLNEMIVAHHLNADQSQALRECCSMLLRNEKLPHSITLIHGVFGSGKSYFLAVLVLTMVKLFNMEVSNNLEKKEFPWKILISSTTNVAVDRILIYLLNFGFEAFVRVGSMKKISKVVLPFSVHSSGSDNEELRELQDMLKSNLPQSEKNQVRKAIERLKKGENKKRLDTVKVVAVTCAATAFPCMQHLKFPVLILDECSQMTEPTSLLPMARFQCEKCILVGDPKQLSPTIQGSECNHDCGLEQTLFDRLLKLDRSPIVLRTQYRCHPTISQIANCLFYENQLLNGTDENLRMPMFQSQEHIPLPTLCFFDVSNGRESYDAYGSYANAQEAIFVVNLLNIIVSYGTAPEQIGVITLYKSQLQAITTKLSCSSVLAIGDIKSIQISTVDAFQGGEKDIIILSCVRTEHTGFIDSDKRMNVALTRAKRHLFVVGNYKMLSKNLTWNRVIDHCLAEKHGLQNSSDIVRLWKERAHNGGIDSQNSITIEDSCDKDDVRKKNIINEKILEISDNGLNCLQSSSESSNNFDTESTVCKDVEDIPNFNLGIDLRIN